MSRRRSVFVHESAATGRLTVHAPYRPDFVRRARALGGRWYEGAWHFGPHRADALGALLDEVFPGWDARPDRPPVATEQMAGTGPGSRPAPAGRGARRG